MITACTVQIRKAGLDWIGLSSVLHPHQHSIGYTKGRLTKLQPSSICY